MDRINRRTCTPSYGRHITVDIRKRDAGENRIAVASTQGALVKKQKPLREDVPNFALEIVETVREPLLILDAALRVRFANRAFYQTFKVSQENTEGRLIYELGNGQWDIAALRTLLEDIVPRSSVFNDFEMEHDFPTIGRKVMLLNARKLRQGKHTEFLVLALEDVTEQRRIHDLELRFTSELQKSLRRLQELEKRRDDLTRMIIHDLRTPLTSVITGMYTLEGAGDLNVDQQEVVTLALNGGETLLGMINDLLDVEKLESGAMQLDYTEFSIAELVASAVGQVASLAESKKLMLALNIGDDLPLFQGDESKLQRTLVNLLGNAIKFTPSGGAITVEAFLADGKKSVAFSVSDTGEGIPPEEFERIFEKFGQVESRQGGRTMSTGLGLTFCRLAVEAHGGYIKVESTPGQGSIFCFTIPLAKNESSTPPDQKEREGAFPDEEA